MTTGEIAPGMFYDLITSCFKRKNESPTGMGGDNVAVALRK
jgi:hypothetical protein